MAEPLEIFVDVSGALPPEVSAGKPLLISTWVFLPDAMPDRPTVISLLNGGTYDRRYFHFEVPGRTGYSLAEYLRQRGHIVVLPDHLGIGASDRASNQMLVTRHIAAAANHAAMTEIYARLAAGTISPAVPPLERMVKVGGGHSMGAFQTITQQAAHRTYDLCLILGYTACGVHLHVDGQTIPADRGPLDFAMPDYILHDRSRLHSTFHWDDVPDDVIAVDDSLLVEVPYVLSAQSVLMGIVREDAARIDVPLYINLGERDVSPDPHAEPGYYRSSRDITLHILPRSGHCQNFAETRLEMYERIDRWVRDQAGH
ncbi:alpha/beta hydrolase [Novosphingobium sp. NDB2Meth1]|uniref:alpha/beta hydrolase n=1 Tax=Novosphingobium sp. NDB2Meth1 TaxID=1892847 RepID=UPI0009311977|nr:alpha/beta fold hydrolase [Novosphingobium sp. NDB2Meth1]